MIKKDYPIFTGKSQDQSDLDAESDEGCHTAVRDRRSIFDGHRLVFTINFDMIKLNDTQFLKRHGMFGIVNFPDGVFKI